MYSIVSVMASIIGSVIMGGIIGLIPFFIANKKGFRNMGLVCLCLCILGNFLAGLYLSVPVCLVSVIVILVKKNKDNPQMNGNPQSAGNEGNKAVFCSYCGTQNDNGTAYCTNCGHRMDS